MNVPDTAEAIHRAASAATYGGGGVAASAGASMGVSKYFGFAVDEWQVIGILAGICIGVAGFLVNLLFQWLRYRRGE